MSKIETMRALNHSQSQLEIVQAAGQMQKTMLALEALLSEQHLRQVLSIIPQEAASLFRTEIQQTLVDVLSVQGQLQQTLQSVEALLAKIPKPSPTQPAKKPGAPYNLPGNIERLAQHLARLEKITLAGLMLCALPGLAALTLLLLR